MLIGYGYDDKDQLTADGAGAYSYDAAGNRDLPGYQTGPGNRLVSDGVWTYTHDDEGNLVKKVRIADGLTWTFGYDHRNQMIWTERRTVEGGSLELRLDYRYDVFARRIEESRWEALTGTTTVRRFGYDGADVLADLDGANVLQVRYVRPDGIDALGARVSASGVVAWYFTDLRGSVIALTDGSGVLRTEIAYDGFGNIVSETDPGFGDRFKYTGREWQEDLGWNYHRRRWYDPATGQWVTEDPIRITAGDYNYYRYAGNDPTNATDPSGLKDFNPHRPNWHHLFPQEFRQQLPKDLRRFVDSPANGWYLLEEDHAQMHEKRVRGHGKQSHWARDWKAWMDKNKNLPKDKFEKALKKQIEKMKEVYGLVDKNGKVLRGKSVKDADGMPYDVYRKEKDAPGTRKEWRKQHSKKAWKASDAEHARNEREGAKRMKKRAKEAAEKARRSAAKKARAAAERAQRSAAKMSRKMAKSTTKTVGKKLAKKIPLVALFFFATDVEAKGAVAGTVNTVLDAAPIVGWGKMGIEFFTGEWFPDKEPPPAAPPVEIISDEQLEEIRRRWKFQNHCINRMRPWKPPHLRHPWEYP